MATNLPPDSLLSEQTSSPTSQDRNSEKEDYNPEVWHLKFRAFSPSEQSDPIQDLKRISELCYQWLRPDLNSKEEILDQLVLEQFLISMPPELQALVKESGVKSCKELEKMLRDGGKPQHWSIIHSQGQLYLLQDPIAKEAEAKEDQKDAVELSQEPLNRDKPNPVWGIPSETEEPCTRQKEEVLLDTVPESREQDDPRPEQSLGSDSVQDREEASVLTPQDPQPTHGFDSVRGEDVKMPQEDTKDAFTLFTHVLERRDLAAHTDLQSLSSSKGDKVPTCQGGASCVDRTENGQLGLPTLRPVEPVDRLPGQAQFVCSDCKKNFLYRSQFILHQRSHTGERPFECSVCNKGFVQSSDLRVHKRIHKGEKPYVCSICSKRFAHKSTLLGHLRIHTKEKPYECEHCGKCFNHRGNLNVHLSIHSDSRPHRCKECDKAFRQQGTLKRHMKIHSRMASEVGPAAEAGRGRQVPQWRQWHQPAEAGRPGGWWPKQ
ncbi:zinc finger and SCAN domain-containing protein 5B-like [Peromyscus californicus insignis]|uniref:zinc finger and SCAN domain-containing protein 5B-like n=1 Tax=Peromyscus californicus insignis TaxID=564181 RepID=UPI0022A6F7B8|nr:zinc finger and SCAN domain-containing protein 5B-like [Peromyscus californicus insignis]